MKKKIASLILVLSLLLGAAIPATADPCAAWNATLSNGASIVLEITGSGDTLEFKVSIYNYAPRPILMTIPGILFDGHVSTIYVAVNDPNIDNDPFIIKVPIDGGLMGVDGDIELIADMDTDCNWYENNRIYESCIENGQIIDLCYTHGDLRLRPIMATGHSYYDEYIVNPDCETPGIVMIRCHNYHNGVPCDYSLSYPAPPNPHTYIEVPATCDDDGYIEFYCDCYDDHNYIQVYYALGHLYEVVDEAPATCKADGYIYWVCSRDPKHFYTDILNRFGHVEGEGVVTRPATQTEDGIMSYYCEVCGELLRTSVIPRLPMEESFVVEFVLGGGIRLDGGELIQSVLYGESAAPPNVRRDGYVFAGWDSDLTNIVSDTVITAQWVKESEGGEVARRNNNQYNSGYANVIDPPSVPLGAAKLEDEQIPVGSKDLFIVEHVAYIIGRDDGLVHPDSGITRAEAATVFYRLLADEMREAYWSLDNPFSDVAPDGWHNAAVSVMHRLGALNGYEDGTFKPDSTITRGELAAISARFARQMNMGGTEAVDFVDISGHWANSDILIAAEVGWVSGYPDNSFKPDDAITRAEFITLANNVLKRAPETVDDLIAEEMIAWDDNANVEAWYYLAIQEATNSHSYEYKTGKNAPNKQFEYERWVETKDRPDWLRLEKEWIAKYSQK